MRWDGAWAAPSWRSDISRGVTWTWPWHCQIVADRDNDPPHAHPRASTHRQHSIISQTGCAKIEIYVQLFILLLIPKPILWSSGENVSIFNWDFVAWVTVNQFSGELICISHYCHIDTHKKKRRHSWKTSLLSVPFIACDNSFFFECPTQTYCISFEPCTNSNNCCKRPKLTS